MQFKTNLVMYHDCPPTTYYKQVH